MKRTQLLTVLTVVLVLLAGCSSITGTDPGQTTAQTTTAEPTLNDVTYPSGVNESGITNSSALVQAHSEALADKSVSYKWSTNTSFTGTESADSVQTDIEMRMKDNPDSNRTWLALDYSGGSVALYTTDERSYAKQVAGGETSYEVSESSDSFRYSTANRGWSNMLEGTLSYASFKPTDVVVRDGKTLIKLEMTEAVDRYQLNTENASMTYDGEMLIDEQGTVHHSEVEITIENDEAGYTYNYHSTTDIQNVGSTTVDEPEWLDEAKSTTGA